MRHRVYGTRRIMIIYDIYIAVDSAGDNKLKIILPKTGQRLHQCLKWTNAIFLRPTKKR